MLMTEPFLMVFFVKVLTFWAPTKLSGHGPHCVDLCRNSKVGKRTCQGENWFTWNRNRLPALLILKLAAAPHLICSLRNVPSAKMHGLRQRLDTLN